MRHPKTLLRIGVIGSVLMALGCFTPILVILFGTLGLAALSGYLDYVLFPALAFFLGLTLYALWRKRRDDARCRAASSNQEPRP